MMSQKNDMQSNVFDVKQKQINQKDHNIQDEDLYPESNENMTCWQKFKNAWNNFINRTIDYFEYDRVFNADGAPKIDIKKCYKRFLENYDQTYSQRQIKFAFSFDYVLQEKIKQQKKKEKNFYTQLYRFICCEGGNEMQEIDQGYKSERQYKEIVRKKLLQKKQEFEEMMKKQEQQQKEKEKQLEIQKQKQKQKLKEIMQNDPFNLQIYDDQQDKKQITKTKNTTETVIVNTKIIKIIQEEQHRRIKKQRIEDQDDDSYSINKKVVKRRNQNDAQNDMPEEYQNSTNNIYDKNNERVNRIARNIKKQQGFINSSTNIRQNETEQNLVPKAKKQQNILNDMILFENNDQKVINDKNKKSTTSYEYQFDNVNSKPKTKIQNNIRSNYQAYETINKNRLPNQRTKDQQIIERSNNNDKYQDQKQKFQKNNNAQKHSNNIQQFQKPFNPQKQQLQRSNNTQKTEFERPSNNNNNLQTISPPHKNKQRQYNTIEKTEVQENYKPKNNNVVNTNNTNNTNNINSTNIYNNTKINETKFSKNNGYQEVSQNKNIYDNKVQKNQYGGFNVEQNIQKIQKPQQNEGQRNRKIIKNNTEHIETIKKQTIQVNQVQKKANFDRTVYQNSNKIEEYDEPQNSISNKQKNIKQKSPQNYYESQQYNRNGSAAINNKKSPQKYSNDHKNNVFPQENKKGRMNIQQNKKQKKDSQLLYEGNEDIPEQDVDSSIQLQSKKRSNKRKNQQQLEEIDDQVVGRTPKKSNNKEIQVDYQGNISDSNNMIRSKKTKKAKQTKNTPNQDELQIDLSDNDDQNMNTDGYSNDKVEIQQQQAHKKRKNKKMIREENVQQQINLQDFTIQNQKTSYQKEGSNTFPVHHTHTHTHDENQDESILQASKKRRNKKQLRMKQDDLNMDEVVFDPIDQVNFHQQKKEDYVPAADTTFVKAEKKRKRNKQRKEDENHNQQEIIQFNF